MFVPVVDSENKPLMPTTSGRARKWIKSGKATPFWKRGVFCVRLNKEPSDRKLQEIAVGIDPGSKREGFSVKSESHTYINIQTETIDWVKDAIEVRRSMRRTRRTRTTPYRKCRWNRSKGEFLAPSTKARWQWKLRICWWLLKMFPISIFIVEDIKAVSKKNYKKWNRSFSPLEVGKKYFYKEVEKLGKLELKQGYETFELRENAGLKKIGNKLSNSFYAHCIDSWVLANWYVGGHVKPDNTSLLEIIPLRLHRRQLHRLEPEKGGKRKKYGGTISLGLKRGSLVRHIKYGLCYVGGYLKDRISLHHIETGKRLAQNVKVQDCKFLSYNSWRFMRINASPA